MRQILVLDDEPLVAMLLEDFLSDLGYATVGPAGSLSEALRLIEAGPIDAAILDVLVGRDLSYPVAAALKARKVPFAFSTGRGEMEFVDPFPDAPILSKPYTISDLANVLGRLLAAAGAVG